MSEKRSCRGLLPPFWWWLFALFGLPLLFLLMTFFRQGVIEKDLTDRVNNALAQENINWPGVEVNQRGRDVLLTGVAPGEVELEKAVSVARNVYGVNRVDYDADGNIAAGTLNSDNGGQIVRSTETSKMPMLNAILEDGSVVLQGKLGSEEQILDVVKAANERFGSDNVVNQLSVESDLGTAEWLTTTDELFAVLPKDKARLSISENGYEISGTVNSQTERDAVLMRARRLLGDNLLDNITVAPLKSAIMQAALQNGTVTLSGTVSSQDQANQLVQAANQAGDVNVVNQLKIDDQYANAKWIASSGDILGGLLADGGQVKVDNGTLTLTGTVTDEAERNQLIARANQSISASGLRLIDQLKVNASADETAVAAVQDPETSAPDNAACQQKMDTIMKGQTILFTVNKADIRRESYPLLDQLVAVVSECKDGLTGKVLIGGHTDSDGSDSYNLELSQQRAGAVRTYLQDKGVPSGLMEARGFGESQPVASNNTSEGKAKNRRISFEIK